MDKVHENGRGLSGSTNLFSKGLIDNFEAIGGIVTRIMDKVESQYRVFHIVILWLPVYKRDSLLLEYWLKRRTRFNKKH